MSLSGISAIIDLGSNTFHLLIFRADPSGFFKSVYRERIFTGLAKGGVDTIQESSYIRGIKALECFNAKVKEYKVESLKIVGTSALREASNGPDFIAEVKAKYDFNIELISSDEEARLIYEGVRRYVNMQHGNYLIMDIGGGSVEFIVVEEGEMSFAKSYKVGLGVLHNAFNKSDPISSSDQKRLWNFLKTELSDLLDRLRTVKNIHLVGSSGSFEVIEEMYRLNEFPPEKKIPVSYINKVYHDIIDSTYNQRLQMGGLPPQRADLIVVAMILVKLIVDAAKPLKFELSPYALKEGLIAESLNI